MGLEDKPFLLKWSSEDMSWGCKSKLHLYQTFFMEKKPSGPKVIYTKSILVEQTTPSSLLIQDGGIVEPWGEGVTFVMGTC